MSSVTESNLGLNYGWAYGESGWNSGMDENLVKLGFASRKQVKGILSTPPEFPENGAAYIVGTVPTGVFTSNYNKIAVWDGSKYLFITPRKLDVIYNKANGCDYIYDNGWVLKQSPQESNYIIVNEYSFLTGYTITNPLQIVYNESDGKYYQWTGATPVTITPNTLPADYAGVSGTFVEATLTPTVESPLTNLPRILSFCSFNELGYVSGNTIAYYKADHNFIFPTDFAGSYADFTVRQPYTTNQEIGIVGIYADNLRIGSVQFNLDGTSNFVMYEESYNIIAGTKLSFIVDQLTYIDSFTLTLMHTLEN